MTIFIQKLTVNFSDLLKPILHEDRFYGVAFSWDDKAWAGEAGEARGSRGSRGSKGKQGETNIFQ